MIMILSELCAETKNYFVNQIYDGTFSISNNSIERFDFLQEGQYFRICGSIFNDGVWKYPDAELKDETFDGTIWALSIPPDFLALAEEISKWQEKNGENATGIFQSESFGNYRYSKATGENGASFTWKDIFYPRYKRYRRLNVL